MSVKKRDKKIIEILFVSHSWIRIMLPFLESGSRLSNFKPSSSGKYILLLMICGYAIELQANESAKIGRSDNSVIRGISCFYL